MFQWDDFGILKGAGQTVAQAGIDFDGGSGDMLCLDGQQLTNQGTAALSVQRLRLLNNATFVNQAGALLDIRGAANIDVNGVDAGVGTLDNAGTLRVSAGTVRCAHLDDFQQHGRRRRSKAANFTCTRA